MAREETTRAGIDAFPRELGRRFAGRAVLYLAGGSMLEYEGFRSRTLDIDYRVEITAGDDGQFIQALRAAQRAVNLDVEPASPADFIPLPAGWRERSRFLVQEGGLTVYAFDTLSMALAKIERGQERDIVDVLALCQAGLLTVEAIERGFEEIALRIEGRIGERDNKVRQDI